MRLRRNSVKTQGGHQVKIIKMDFKFKLTRKHINKKNVSNIQLRKTGNST